MRVVSPSLFDVHFRSNSVPPWNILGDYTVFKNSYASRFLLWSFLSAITVVFSKFQVSENIHEGFFFSTTLKADFCDNVLLQIFSLVETCFIEIRVLLRVTLQKEFLQVRFVSISRTNTLRKCIQTQLNI